MIITLLLDDVIFDGEKEMVVEIALTLPPNYPLRACSVAINQHLNVGEALWRKVHFIF